MVKTGGRVRAQIVCGFEYLKDEKHGFVTVLMNPTDASRVRQRIDRAADSLVQLLQHNGTAQSVYRLDESQGLVAED